jgi:excisionase family DNA binding protein
MNAAVRKGSFYLLDGWARQVRKTAQVLRLDDAGKVRRWLEGKHVPVARPARPTLMAQRERGVLREAAAILGLSERTVRMLADLGELPGAVKIGRRWTFDLEQLRRYVRGKAETWQRNARPRKAASGAGKHSGVGRKSRVGTSSGAYGQTIQRLRNGGSKKVRRGR